MRKFIAKLYRNTVGATAIEYGLIAALVSVGIIAGLNLAGPAISTAFTTVGNAVNGAVTPK